MTIRCEIVSQDRFVYQDEVDIVVLPGVEGEMGILPHHAPLLTALQVGIIRIRKSGEEQYFTVAGGIAEVQPDQVTILADAAENVEEIDVKRAEEARRRAEEFLKKGQWKMILTRTFPSKPLCDDRPCGCKQPTATANPHKSIL